jgi:hypothetical protein
MDGEQGSCAGEPQMRDRAVALGRVLLRLQLDLCSVLLSRSFSRRRRQLDKDFPPSSIK